MRRVEEIEREIEGLSPEERVSLRKWIEESQADARERHIENNAIKLRIDRLADEARADVAAGRVRDR